MASAGTTCTTRLVSFPEVARSHTKTRAGQQPPVPFPPQRHFIIQSKTAEHEVLLLFQQFIMQLNSALTATKIPPVPRCAPPNPKCLCLSRDQGLLQYGFDGIIPQDRNVATG